MESSARTIPFRHTHFFSSLILDYLDRHPAVEPFFAHAPDREGFAQAIEARKAYPTNRTLLQMVLREAYSDTSLHPRQADNLDKLGEATTFTICTAHQPNIFSGYLYFVYKTLHAVTLAEWITKEFPGIHAVPVFYIGSEDNDLDELSQCNLDGQKLRWETKQTGAVGRMKVDKSLVALLDQVYGRVGVEPHGQALMDILRNAYREGDTIAHATFRLLNSLFAEYGLLVLDADRSELKQQMVDIFRNDLTDHLPHALVSATSAEIDKTYKSQVHPREINLFYLEDGGRYRIMADGEGFALDGDPRTFGRDELLGQLQDHPERFSPNVVLRGIYQERILPNIAFVGGGSEIAYWLELKNLFLQFDVPFPVLVLRNSFLLADQRNQDRLQKSGWSIESLFTPEEELMNLLVRKQSQHPLELGDMVTELQDLYARMAKQAGAIDKTLSGHVEALQARAMQRVQGLEKKMLRAEKRKFEAERRQLREARLGMFPNNTLQERVDNFMPWYARYGQAFVEAVYRHSPALPPGFVLMEVRD